MADSENTRIVPDGTITPIMRLAGRLTAAWDVFRDHDRKHLLVRPPKPKTQADRDFARLNDANGLHAQIAGLRATNLEESMIRVAVMSAVVDNLAIDIERTMTDFHEALSDMLAHAEASGVTIPECCWPYYLRRAPSSAGEA